MRERRKISRDTLAGSLLLAHPAMKDPNFRRSVVLMSAHNAEGAMGVVLNRPLGKRLGELSDGRFAGRETREDRTARGIGEGGESGTEVIDRHCYSTFRLTKPVG